MSLNALPSADSADSGVRNVELQQLVDLLKDQSTRRLDVVAGAGAMHSIDGRLVLDNTEPQIGPDGVTNTAGVYQLNSIAISGLAEKLKIPQAYLRRLATEHPTLFDANVNGWLDRTNRRFLVRCLRSDDGDGSGHGVARAVLSDRYGRIDNLDVLYSVLEGIRGAGVAVNVDGCDLTDRRMYLRIYSPEVQANAAALLGGYKSPFDGRSGKDLPTVWGGFVVTNSETGCGKFTLTPRLMVQVCRNGLVLPHSAKSRTHLGAQLTDDGVIEWSAASTRATLELITTRTTDAVRAYLDADFVTRSLRELEEQADATVTDPDTTIKTLGQQLRYSEDQQKDILNHFIAGGDRSAGGILHAVTSVAQTLPDADAAHEMELTAIQAMRLAAA
ncbi:DUF932 domain-containing protein [Cryptosporangium sp. NPDC048952]|uniref:DUF932 domain-containing protein n=1 Tax=Cryptosporangium sp. NPDC048952 TaxID=3363961 RepID=UPI0037171B6D